VPGNFCVVNFLCRDEEDEAHAFSIGTVIAMATAARKSPEKLNFCIELSCVENTAMCRGMRTDQGREKRGEAPLTAIHGRNATVNSQDN